MAKKKKFDLVNTGVRTLSVVAGYVGGKALNKLPVVKDQSPLIQGGGKFALGLAAALFFSPKNDKDVVGAAVESVGYGLAAAGGIELLGQVAPEIVSGIPFDAPIALQYGPDRVNGTFPTEIGAIAEEEVALQ